MCCRYYTTSTGDLTPMIEAARRAAYAQKIIKELKVRLVTEGEVYPTDAVPVIAPGKDKELSAFIMLWGFRTHRSESPIINARVESASYKPTFRESWERRRCVIPASHYFEWEHTLDPLTGKSRTGEKFVIRPKGSKYAMLAGIYRIEEINGIKIPVFAILTGEPGESIRHIHNRMPVILPYDAVNEWIDPDADPSRTLRRALTDMEFRPADQRPTG